MMFASFLRLLSNEYRTRRMARYTLWVLVFGAALAAAVSFGVSVSWLWWLVFWANFAVAGAYVIVRLVGFVRHRLLWRVRRRLIVTHLFIGAVPMLLLLLLIGIGAFIINGQFAAFLVEQRLRNHFDQLLQLNRAVVHEVRAASAKSPDELFDRLQMFYVHELSRNQDSYPRLEVTLHIGTKTRAFRLDGQPGARPVEVPAWFHSGEFAGVVVDDAGLSLRSIERGSTSVGDLTLILSQPFTPELLDLVARDIGPVDIYLLPEGSANVAGSSAPAGAPQRVHSSAVQLPPPADLLDRPVSGFATLEPIVWSSPHAERLPRSAYVSVASRIVTLNRRLLSTLGELTGVYVTMFVVVAAVLLAMLVAAVVIGLKLTRSIATTVDRLHAATQRVEAGDFYYRVNLPAKDQLSSLGDAFDHMTASVERLLRESEEKSRLESELEIAREVQRALFPGKFPEVPGLALYGVCKPARTVSGDYFDFQRLSRERVALVLGDVSGKGISAALLMAAIQASLRSQFYNGRGGLNLSDAVPVSTSEIVARLNRQLLDSTTAEKYTTFFYAIYDAATRRLTYTNAGHLAPALYRRGQVLRLNAGGTVVGLFPATTYDQGEVQFEPGDVLLAFTDGLTEPENSFGEEMGEERLLRAAGLVLRLPPEQIAQEIYREVDEWTGSPELQDDMTMIIVKATG